MANGTSSVDPYGRAIQEIVRCKDVLERISCASDAKKSDAMREGMETMAQLQLHHADVCVVTAEREKHVAQKKQEYEAMQLERENKRCGALSIEVGAFRWQLFESHDLEVGYTGKSGYATLG
jgi:predicted nucleic acid-binding protein